MLRKTLIYNNILNKIFQVPDKIVFRWGMLFPVLILMCISLITLKYTSVNSSFFSSTFTKQIVWFGLGSFVFILAQWIRIQYFQEYAFHFYGILIIFIAITYIMPVIGGSQRWVIVGPFSFQPSEVGKLLLVFVIARVLADQKNNMNEIKLLLLKIL